MRFHAMQSVIFGIANSVLMTVLAILAVILTFAFGIGGAMVGGGIGTLVQMLVWLIWLLFWVIGLALFIGLIFAAYKAYQGEKFKLPFIGNMGREDRRQVVSCLPPALEGPEEILLICHCSS